MEDRWADAMVAGSDMKVNIRAIYSNDSFRPDRFQVIQTIEGEEKLLNHVNE